MKKKLILIIIILIISSVTVNISSITNNKFYSSASNVDSNIKEKGEELSNSDAAIAILLSNHIQEAIEDYFGKPTQYALYDARINYIKRIDTDFIYQISITVPTFHGPHNPPYGLETMIFTIKPGNIVILNKFTHKTITP